MNDQLVLATPRLLLRSILPTDQEMVFRGLSDSDVVEFYGVQYSSYEATTEQMKFYTEVEESNTGKFWAVTNKDSGEFMGVGGVYFIKKEHRKGEIGFWMLKPFWGKGYLQEAIKEILNYSFKNLHLHRIEGIVEEENFRCRKAIEKAGFLYEGTLKDAELKKGKFISLCYYAIFNEA